MFVLYVYESAYEQSNSKILADLKKIKNKNFGQQNRIKCVRRHKHGKGM